jgi:hypothetical protein
MPGSTLCVQAGQGLFHLSGGNRNGSISRHHWRVGGGFIMQSEGKDKVYAETNVDEPRNENLQGGKSTKSSVEEARQEKKPASQKIQHTDRQPPENKAEQPILKEDADKKAEASSHE